MRRRALQPVRGTAMYTFGVRRIHHLRLRAWKAVHDIRARARPPSPYRFDPYRVVLVNPRLVHSILTQRLPPQVSGRYLAGSWDQSILPIDATALYKGLQQRFQEGRAWLDTGLHPERYVRRCENDPPQYEHYTLSQFLHRGRYLDSLYDDLRAVGYVDYRTRREPVGTEMTIAVTRTGVYARNSGGMHRLIMSQLLGLAHVPARILVVHAECYGTDRDPIASGKLVPLGEEASDIRR